MSDVALATSTGHKEIDRVLSMAIGGFEKELSGLFRGYYVVGSYASGTALETSDLDLVFEGRAADNAQRERAKNVLDACRQTTTLDLGVFPLSGDALHGIYNPVFKLRSLFLYGQDIRDTVPLVPVEEWARQCMHGIYRVMGRDDEPAAIKLPRTYPDPQGEFYGYDKDTVRLPDGSKINGTRGLVTGAGWMATALIGLRARHYVLGKGEFAILYRRHINDAWASFLEDLYDSCRRTWGYLVPEKAEDRGRLRALCRQYPQFEDHFLTVYRRFALAQLQGNDDEALLQTLRALEHLPFQDTDIEAAVRALQDRGDERVRRAAGDTVRAFGQRDSEKRRTGSDTDTSD